MPTTASALFSGSMLAVFALGGGGLYLLARRRERKQAVLMLLAAAVLFVNVLIWTLPV